VHDYIRQARYREVGTRRVGRWNSWGGFCTAADANRIDSFLRRLVKYGYSCSTTDFQTYLKLADQKLFNKMCIGEQHCLHQMLPALKAETSTYVLRKRKHP